MTTIHGKSVTVLSRAISLSILLCVFPALIYIFAQGPQVTDVARSRDAYQAAQVRYAQSYLDLAKHELNVAEQMKNSISRHALENKRVNVKAAEEQLRVASLPMAEADTAPIRLRFAEENAKHARNDYMKVVEAQKANKNGYTDAQVETFRLKAEVAENRLMVMSNPLHMMSLLDHMHWEIDRLNEDLFSLQSQLEELKKR